MIGRDDMTFCINCGGNMVEAPADPLAAKASATPMDGVANEAVSAPAEPAMGMNGATVNEPVTKPKAKINKNTALLIGIIAAVLVGIGGIVFGIVMANSKGNRGQTANTTPTTITVTKTEVPVGKWIFEIPDGLEYEVENGGLWLSDGEEWESFTSYQGNITYSKAKTNLDTYAEAIAKNINGKVYETGEDTFGDTDFAWMDFVNNSGKQYGTYAFSEASDMYTFLTSFINAEATIDHDILDVVSEVLSSARIKTDNKEIIIDGETEETVFDIKTTIDFAKQEQEQEQEQPQE